MYSKSSRFFDIFILATFLLCSLTFLVAFGFVGIGRSGEFGVDMRFLYVAGKIWQNHQIPI